MPSDDNRYAANSATNHLASDEHRLAADATQYHPRNHHNPCCFHNITIYHQHLHHLHHYHQGSVHTLSGDPALHPCQEHNPGGVDKNHHRSPHDNGPPHDNHAEG